jgi:hypothetical protein
VRHPGPAHDELTGILEGESHVHSVVKQVLRPHAEVVGAYASQGEGEREPPCGEGREREIDSLVANGGYDDHSTYLHAPHPPLSTQSTNWCQDSKPCTCCAYSSARRMFSPSSPSFSTNSHSCFR